LAQRARDIMTPNPRTIEGRALAVEAVALMNDPSRPITVLFITEEGRPVGALHLHDCLRAGIA
jgi:arabinose-5-phosphate isomerase